MDFRKLSSGSWYPGHMLKAEREMKAKLPLVDVIIELLDARCPASSRNNRLAVLAPHKDRLLLMGKSDLADPDTTRSWQKHWRAQGLTVLSMHHRQQDARARILRALGEFRKRKPANAMSRLAGGRPLRVMIVGVPNVGKSTLINGLTKRRGTKVGPTPGVTRSQQWVLVGDGVELLDTPGVMPPRLDDAETGLRLGLVACIKEELVGVEILAEYWLHVLKTSNHFAPLELYGLTDFPIDVAELLESVGRRRGLLRQGGETDLRQAATAIVRDFQTGRHGPISLETPSQYPPEA